MNKQIANNARRAAMNNRPAVRRIACCVGAALAQLGAGLACADSGVGVDTALGNALNPPGRSAVPRAVDPEGFDTVRRSPTGQLYGLPMDLNEPANRTENGWEYSGGIEAGLLGGDANEKAVLFRKYKDVKNGAYLNYFEVEAEKKASASYIQAFGGGTGFHDQFYGLQFGKYNDWKVKVFYNEIIHVFTDTWKSLHNGEGTGNLTTGLPAPLVFAPRISTTLAAGAATLGLTPVGSGSCTAAAPCWQYNGRLYANNIAQAAINGLTGTPNSATGVIPTGVIPTTGANGATNAAQSNIAANIAAKLAATPESELSLVRKKGGIRVDANLTDFWKGYASYSLENRKGARPFATNEGNLSTEIAEPIDYDTHDFLAGLQYADSRTQFNLRASLSLFRNKIGTLNVQDAFLSENTTSGGIQTATFDLYPDNKALNLKGEFARELPDFYKGRFTAALSWGTNRENDDLLAPISAVQNAQLAAAGITTLSGANVGYAANVPALVSNWNTTAALSQQTAKQRIDNTLLDLGLSLRPTDALGLRGTYRYYETDNKGGYTAYNPLTGQFGRGLADGNNLTGLDAVVGLRPGAAVGVPGNCFVPSGFPSNALIGTCQFGIPATVGGTPVITSGANTPVFGQARSTRQTNYGLAADYDLTRTSSLNASLEREEFKRNFRERDKTREDKFKLGYVNRALGNATLRLSFEDDRKRGGDYRYRTFEDLGTGLPGLDINTIIAQARANPVATNPYFNLIAANLFNRYSFYFRKYDQADRNQKIINTRLNMAPREDMDFGVTLQFKRADYPDSFYGLKKDDQNSLTFDFNFQPSTERSYYAFYSYQKAKKSQDLNSGVAGANTCTLANLLAFGISACSDNINGVGGTRPATSAWSERTDDRNDVFGFGMQRELGRIRLGVDYTYSSSKTRIDYNYGGAALNATPAAQAAADAINAAAGYALPNMTFVQHTLNLNVLVPIGNKWSMRIFDRYEIGRVKDWHYDDVIKYRAAAYDTATLLLDGGAQNYHANVVGVMVQFKL